MTATTLTLSLGLEATPWVLLLTYHNQRLHHHHDLIKNGEFVFVYVCVPGQPAHLPLQGGIVLHQGVYLHGARAEVCVCVCV